MELPQPKFIGRIIAYYHDVRKRNSEYQQKFKLKHGTAEPDYAFAIPLAFMFLIVLICLSGGLN